jgi:hypothetical protein
MGGEIMTLTPTREELSLSVEMARWDWLRPHLERGGLVVISPELDMVAAGFSITSDDSAAVNAWIATGRIAKPSATQIFDWDADPDTPFRFLIATPYVLIQPLSPLVS